VLGKEARSAWRSEAWWSPQRCLSEDVLSPAGIRRGSNPILSGYPLGTLLQRPSVSIYYTVIVGLTLDLGLVGLGSRSVGIEFYSDCSLRRQYPPLSLGQLQLLIDTNRLDGSLPIDLPALCNTKILVCDPQEKHFGFQLTDEVNKTC
jgi:hypothetical protein